MGLTRGWTSRLVRAQSALGWSAAMLLVVALYMAFIYAPEDVNLGVVQRIFYIHVASAWTAFLAFAIVAGASGLYLWRRRPEWDRLAVACAELGVLFTTTTLASGSLWGKPVWNTWWTWDPRLTTTLILWFLYVGYLLIRHTAEGSERQMRLAAIFGVLGFVDVPVIHVSATLWRSIHPTVVTSSGMNMEPEMAVAMGVSVLAFTVLLMYLVAHHIRISLLSERVERLKGELLGVSLPEPGPAGSAGVTRPEFAASQVERKREGERI